MANAPAFAAYPRWAMAAIPTTANTARDGSGTITTVYTAPATRSVADAVTNSTILLTSATAAFTDADRGAPITGAGIPAGTTIAAVLSATNVHLSQAATASGTGVTIGIVGQGARVDYIQVTQIDANPGAGNVTLFVHDGTNARYYGEFVFTSTTQPTSAIAPETKTLTLSQPILLPPGYSLRCAPTIVKSFVIEAAIGAF